MRKLLVILFCSVILTAGLFAGVMNCEEFDKDIDRVFNHYGNFGVEVKLLYVKAYPTAVAPGFYCEVMVWVKDVYPGSPAKADTWFFSGIAYHRSGPVPAGICLLEKDKLIGCCNAAKKLPPGFPLAQSTVTLVQALTASADNQEPCYYFEYKGTRHAIGAYTGKIYL